jgi:hypothetical protein
VSLPEELRTQISPEAINLLLASDGATVALINLLLCFLDLRGVISRQEFIGFLEGSLAKNAAGKDGDYVQKFLKMKIDGLSHEPPVPH